VFLLTNLRAKRMKQWPKNHMSPEDRAFTERQLKAAELSLERAEQSSGLAKELKAGIEATEDQRVAFDEGERFRQAVQGSSKTSSALSTRRTNPFLPKRPVSQLRQVTNNIAAHVSEARYFQENADLKVRGMVTPTARVNDFRKRGGENRRRIEDLTENLQETRNFLGRYSRYSLTEGRQEEK
jgi:hypothetical protein